MYPSARQHCEFAFLSGAFSLRPSFAVLKAPSTSRAPASLAYESAHILAALLFFSAGEGPSRFSGGGLATCSAEHWKACASAFDASKANTRFTSLLQTSPFP